MATATTISVIANSWPMHWWGGPQPSSSKSFGARAAVIDHWGTLFAAIWAVSWTGNRPEIFAFLQHAYCNIGFIWPRSSF
jgi:hypothetical protein